MSSIKLESNASGTGVFTIASPNSNTNRTLTLPDQTGTVLTGSGAIGVNASAPTNSVAIDSSGNVGIGTTSPSTAANGGLTLGTTSAGKSLILNSSSSGNNGLIRFIDSAGSNSAELVGGTSQISIYGYGSRQMTFWTNGTERLTIPSDSAGIKFPATQAASSDANTLDDYEEGSFTPGFTINNSATGITFSVQIGRYTKIGRQVSIYCGVVLSNKGSSSGVARITNLPFTSADFGAYGDAVISVGFIDSLNTASAPLIGLIPRGESRIEVRKISGGGTSILSDTDLTNSSAIIVGATYFV